MRKGILAAGNWIVDQVKITDCFPGEETLANILEEYNSNGGSAYNLVKALRRLGAAFPLDALGLLGEDDRGNSIIEDCEQLGVSTRQLRKTAGAYTSYTDVMSVQSTGKRTFFHQRGANALLDESHFEFSLSAAKIFHLGYLLLLDKMDLLDAGGSTGAARVLESASSQGFITSADVVSEDSNRFASVVPPSLRHLDYFFFNELEAFRLTGISTGTGSDTDIAGCLRAARCAIDMGVRRWAVLHFPGGAIAVSVRGEQVIHPGVQVPAGKVAGTVGAGDAFAAGVLMGIHEEKPMEQSLRFGVCTAAASLLKPTSSDGILPLAECLELGTRYGYRRFPAVV